MDRTVGKLVIGLESGLEGGSISVLENGHEIDFAKGSGNISKTEDLLALLESLLKKNRLQKKRIGLIAVSDAPGSATGLRIGQSIARGLGAAFGAEVRQISILDALAIRAEREGIFIVALEASKNGLFFKRYRLKNGEIRGVSEIEKLPGIYDFSEKLKSFGTDNINLICTENISRQLSEYTESKEFVNKSHIITVKENFGKILGIASTSQMRLII